VGNRSGGGEGKVVTPAEYIPRRGDVVWINLNPQVGHEQAGRRPAVVLSPEKYNRKTGLALFCPVTSRVKGYPFEVPVPDGLPVKGVILSDEVKSLDWRARDVDLVSILPEATVDAVFQKLDTLLN
jgi:mRNA interferase MazF